MRAAQHAQATEFDGTIADREPTRPGIARALDQREVLMWWRWHERWVRRHHSGDVAWMGQHLAPTEQVFVKRQQPRVVGQPVERLEALHILIGFTGHANIGAHFVFRYAVDRLDIEVTVKCTHSRFAPAVPFNHSEHLAPNLEHIGFGQEPFEKQVALAGCPLEQGRRVSEQWARVDELKWLRGRCGGRDRLRVILHVKMVVKPNAEVHTPDRQSMDIFFTASETPDHDQAIIVSANWYQFGGGERLHNPRVESRMLLWCEAGTGRVRINDLWNLLNADDFLLLPWQHEVTYEADTDSPFLVAGIHIIPHHARGVPVVFAASHQAADELAGSSERRDVFWPQLEGLVYGSFVSAKRLDLLTHYVVESWSPPPPERAARELARLLIEELFKTVSESQAGVFPQPLELR